MEELGVAGRVLAYASCFLSFFSWTLFRLLGVPMPYFPLGKKRESMALDPSFLSLRLGDKGK